MYFTQLVLVLSIVLLAETTLAANVNTCQSTNITAILKEDHQRLFENEIAKLVECIRQFLINGIPGVTLDPFKFPIIPLYLDTSLVSSSMWLTNIFLGGLASFNLDKGTVNINVFPPQAVADVALSFGQIKLATNYNGNVEIAKLIKLSGKGSLSIQFDNLMVSFQAVVNIIPISIKELKVHIRLPSTKADVTGLFNDSYMSSLISKQMTETFTQLAQEQETNFNNLINDFLQQLLTVRLAPIIPDLHFDEIVQMAYNDNITCNTSAQTTFEILTQSLKSFLTQTSTINLEKYFYSEK